MTPTTHTSRSLSPLEDPGVAAQLLRSIAETGTEVVFAAWNPTTMALARAVTAEIPLRLVLAVHEQGAGHMAQGYARASGNTGVVLAFSRQGVTNLVTPVADAWMDSTPLVCIAAMPPVTAPADLRRQWSARELMAPVVKGAWAT